MVAFRQLRSLTNFASLGVRSQQVDDFDTGDQDFLSNVHFNELGSFGVDGSELVGVDRAPFVNGFT